MDRAFVTDTLLDRAFTFSFYFLSVLANTPHRPSQFGIWRLHRMRLFHRHTTYHHIFITLSSVFVGLELGLEMVLEMAERRGKKEGVATYQTERSTSLWNCHSKPDCLLLLSRSP
jgi:hypothetical protein